MTDDSDLIQTIAACHRRARNASASWRDEAREDYDFVAGHQWSDEDKAYLASMDRPAITFNRIGPTIDAVAGSEVSNRQEVRYIPRELGDSGVNELLTGAAKWVRDNCDAEDEESDAFLDTVICGMGWTETHVEYDEEPDGMIIIDRVDPMEMYWDPAAKKRNLNDARWVQRVKKYSKAEFKERWPDIDPLEVSNPSRWVDLDENNRDVHDATEAWMYKNDQGSDLDRSNPAFIVVRHEWFELAPVYRVRNPDGQGVATLTKAKWTKLEGAAQKMGVELKAVRTEQRKYKFAYVCGDKILEKGSRDDEGGFQHNCITAKRDRNSGTWYGLVRAMKDPQRWANKMFVSLTHIYNSNSKGGVIAETDAFENQRQAEESWSRADAITWAKNGAIAGNKIMPKQSSGYPPAVDRLLEVSISSIRDVSGVNLELLGMAEREQAGVLEYQRKQAGLTILATIFDSLRRYRKVQGRLLLRFIQAYISDGRLIRINGQMGPQYAPLVREEGTAEYDVIVDDAPTSPNQKEQVFQVLTQMMPFLAEIGALPPPDVLDYAPLPETLVQKWKQQLIQAQQQPTQDPAMMKAEAEIQGMQMQLQAKMQEMQAKLEMQREENAAEIEIERQKLAMEAQKLQADIEMKRMEIGQKMQLQREQATADMQMKSQQGQQDLALRRQQGEADIQLKQQQAKESAALKRKQMASRPRAA